MSLTYILFPLDILRAVAERAMRESPPSLSRDEIITSLGSIKDLDNTKTLGSTKDDPLSTTISGKISRTKKTTQEYTPLVREKKKDIGNDVVKSAQVRNRTTLKSRTERPASTRHVAFHAAEESEIRNQAQNSAILSSRIETPTAITQQPSKLPASQGWSLLSTVKNIVASPLKVFGLGFVQNEENLKNVTKNINFEFNPPITPTPSDRRKVKINGAATQHRARRNISRDSTARKLAIPQTDRPIRQRKLESHSIDRHIDTERRRDEFLYLKKPKKSQTQKNELKESINRRRKKPTKRLEVSNPKLETLSSHDPKIFDKQIEEWPKNLDPSSTLR